MFEINFKNSDLHVGDVVHFQSGDTSATKNSSLSAEVACGGLINLAAQVVDNELQNGFAIIRPPGKIFNFF